MVTYAHLLFAHGLAPGITGNLSVRLGSGDILITPGSRSLRSLSVGDIVRTDATGMLRNPAQFPSREFGLHLALYRARDDMRCMIHTHPTFVTAWSKSIGLFPLDSVSAAESLDKVALVPYLEVDSPELATVSSKTFAGGASILVLQRHGLSVAGRTLEDAFVQTQLAEQVAELEYYARALHRQS